MKLPISLVVLAVLSQALSVHPLTKRSEAKGLETKSAPAKSPVTKGSQAKASVTNQKDSNQTSKRELYEGNFGERNKELSSKYEVVSGPTPKIVYAKELREMVSEQSPTHQTFGMRLPQIVKISDVLSEQGRGSFEAAVAKHLYSPISVYQARLSSPTSFEVPAPAASQSAYSNRKPYELRQASEKEQNLPEAQKTVELPNPQNIPLYTVNQPRLRFEAYPQHLDHGLPQEIFRPQHVPRKHMPSLIPIYDQLGPFRYPGQVVPSQYLHQNGIYQIFPGRPGFNFGSQEGNGDKNYPNQENQEQSNAERPKPQIDIPVPKQGYHAHPNGAISFASFSQKLPVKKQYEPLQQQYEQSQQAQLQSQPIPVRLPPQTEPEVIRQSPEQEAQLKQNHQFPPMFHRLIQDLEKYQPIFQQKPQFIAFTQQNQPRPLNQLQQHLLYQDPRQLSNPQVIQLERLPAFKPLPQSLLRSESFSQQTSRSPIILGQSPRPFSFEYQSRSPPENFDLKIQPASSKLTPLPPLKPNYSKYVKPLEPHSHTTPVFLPTPLQTLSSSTPREEPVSDQLISSTTIQPTVKHQEDSEKHPIQEETKPQSQISQSLKPEIVHQSAPTVQPPSIQSTTYLPFVTREPQSIHFQYSTPQPQYQSTISPQTIKAPPRHEVVIQRQEIQELFFEPSPQPLSTPHYQNQRTQGAPQYERELLQLRSQPHHQLFEQLQPLLYQREIQDINSQQYLLEARQSHSAQKPDSLQQREPQQYLIQQHSHPLQLLQLLQSHQNEQQQSEQQHQVTNQEQPHQQYGSEEQAQQLKHAAKQAQQQQVAEQAQQQQQQQQHLAEQEQQVTEQAQQQLAEREQQVAEQVQQQQHVAEQERQVAEQERQVAEKERQVAEQERQVAEQAQQQQELQAHLDSNNQIQLSTFKPSEDTEKQTETVEIEEQTESQSTTEKLNEQSEHSSEFPSLEQPYLGPLLNPSVLPQIYAHQQQLVAQPEYEPLLGVPPYSDVQYYGKFAKSLFGNRHQ